MAAVTLLTVAEFLNRPDRFDASGNLIREELLGGEIIGMAAPDWRHDRVKNKIGKALILHLNEHPELGLEAVIEYAFQVSPSDLLTPDVSVLYAERFRSFQSRLIEGAPEIAIEVVSPTDTAIDIKKKVDAYLANGAASVWVFFADQSVIVHTITQLRQIRADQALEDPLLAGFSIPVSQFFALDF